MNAFITLSMLLSMALVGSAQLLGNAGGPGSGAGGSNPNLILPMLLRSGIDMRSLMVMMSMSKNGQGGAGGSSGMGSLPLMMALGGGSDNLLPLIMMMGKGKTGKIDPMMMMMAMGGGNDNLMQMLPFLMAKNNGNAGLAGITATAPSGAAQQKPAGLV